jgi:outer membrane receptor protein involved in Fe transport
MCADPNSPCNGIPNAFSSDPDLKGVISKTFELGFRGAVGADIKWRAAAFHSVLSNDILFNQTNATQGYFSNVAQTQRQGLELGLDCKVDRLDYALNASWIDATFLSSFVIANGSNNVCIATNGVGNGCAGVYAQPGDKIPGIPALTLKLRLGYAITSQSHLGITLQAQSSQYARGDENNQDIHGQVPGFASVKLDWTQRLNKSTSLFFGVNNLFNRQYANFGMLSANQLTTGLDEQFRGVSAPWSVYVGADARF